MRTMERIRTQGKWYLLSFAIIFVVSVFAGLGIGGSFSGRQASVNPRQAASTYRSLVPGVDAVAKVNGHEIDFTTYSARLQSAVNNMRSGQGEMPEDPFEQVGVNSQVLDYLIREAVLTRYAQDNGLGVGDSEVNAKFQEMIQQSGLLPGSGEKSKSLVSELGRKFQQSREYEKAEKEFLDRQGMTKTRLKQELRRDLVVLKASDHIKAEEEAKAEAAAQGKLEKIKAALDGGEDFGAVAKEFSDDKGTRDKGGVFDQMVPRGFFDEAFDSVVFDMKVGTVSEPIKTEFGYQIVKLLEKKAAEGAAWDKWKRETIATKKQENPDYTPDDEALKKEYEQVRVQHITLRTLADRETEGRINWMIFSSDIEVYDPQILAWRAASTEPLYFPQVADTTMEQIARSSLLAEGTDLSNMEEIAREYFRVKLMRYQRAYGDPPEELRPQFEQYNLEYGVEWDPATAPDYPKLQPLYPLAAGLAMEAVNKESDWANNHYILAAIYDKWLDDDDSLALFPLDLDTTRELIEQELNTAIDLNEYEAYYYALAGKNYAWWVKPDKAREMLAKAEEFASVDDMGIYRILTKAYGKNGDTEKNQEMQQKVFDLQRAQWEAQQGQGGWTKVNN
jgi:foldase protein PrsA